MRFHVGFSFRLKNLIKFLIPLGIGICAYFGLPLMFGSIKVNALVNTETSFDLTLEDTLIPQSTIDIYDNVISSLGVSDYYDIYISYRSSDSFLFFNPKSNGLDVGVFNEGAWLQFYPSNDEVTYIVFPNDYDITTDTNFNNIKACYTNSNDRFCFFDYSLDGGAYVSGGMASPSTMAFGVTNDSDYSTTLTSYFYYSAIPLYYNYLSNSSSSDVYYKTLIINNDVIDVGSRLYTYYDLFISQPEPEPEPTPEPSEKDITDYVYWFYDNYTEYDILVNIYILLWVFVLFNIFFKCIGLIKGVKW